LNFRAEGKNIGDEIVAELDLIIDGTADLEL